MVLRRAGRDLPVLCEVGFDVAPGEVLGIPGESGAGKSVAGAALRRTGGEIALMGDRPDRMTPGRLRRVRGRRVGRLFRDPMTSLDPGLGIGRQLQDRMCIRLRLGAGALRARAIGWLERAGLPDPPRMLDWAPHELSGGQRQRAVIALALGPEPGLVIADEPTTALDVPVRAQMLALLRDLHAQTGNAMIPITHDPGVVAGMADRVAAVRAERLVETAPTGQLFARPRHPCPAGRIARCGWSRSPRPCRGSGRCPRAAPSNPAAPVPPPTAGPACHRWPGGCHHPLVEA